MKKSLLCLLVFVCSMSLFTACNDDDNNENNSATKSLSNSTTGTLKNEKNSDTDSIIDKAPLQDDDDLHN